MRARRWGDRCLIGRHDRNDGGIQSLMTHVMQSSLTVSLKSSKSHGTRIPQSILLRADGVI